MEFVVEFVEEVVSFVLVVVVHHLSLDIVVLALDQFLVQLDGNGVELDCLFLPIATRFFHRSRSSSNRYTTPASSPLTYYYCTSDADSDIEIQCDSSYGDTQCCENTTIQEAFCCGGDIPDDFLEDTDQATRTIERIFYTLAALALCTHILMRRLYN